MLEFKLPTNGVQTFTDLFYHVVRHSMEAKWLKVLRGEKYQKGGTVLTRVTLSAPQADGSYPVR